MTLQTVNVSIMNDDLLEIDEVFTASLTLENTADAARVNLQPDSAEVTILDEDSEYKSSPNHTYIISTFDMYIFL